MDRDNVRSRLSPNPRQVEGGCPGWGAKCFGVEVLVAWRWDTAMQAAVEMGKGMRDRVTILKFGCTESLERYGGLRGDKGQWIDRQSYSKV